MKNTTKYSPLFTDLILAVQDLPLSKAKHSLIENKIKLLLQFVENTSSEDVLKYQKTILRLESQISKLEIKNTGNNKKIKGK